jgi:hypothetical protein
MRLLCSARHIVGAFLALCSALGYGSGIEIETKVYRLFEDGSFELLVLPTAGIETEGNAFSPDVSLRPKRQYGGSRGANGPHYRREPRGGVL